MPAHWVIRFATGIGGARARVKPVHSISRVTSFAKPSRAGTVLPPTHPSDASMAQSMSFIPQNECRVGYLETTS